VVARPWPGGEKRSSGRASHPEEGEAMASLLLPCVATRVSLRALWCLSGATPRGQPWPSAVTLPPGRDGLSVRRMTALWTFHASSPGCHVPREFLRTALSDVTPDNTRNC
jgi:hypothetical protein